MNKKEDMRNVLLGLISVSITILPVYAATSVDSCMYINDSGSYILTMDILDNSSSCIKIRANNVDFDGGGYTIDGMDEADSYGVQAGSDYTNITVRNLTVTDWFYGIFYQNTSSGRITGITAVSNVNGIYLDSSSNDDMIDNSTTLNNTNYGIYLYLNTNNTIRDNTANNNSGSGIVINNSNNNIVTGNIMTSNSNYGIYLSSSGNNTIYNNHFNNTNNYNIDAPNIWNTTMIEGMNIISGSNLGGNYWAYPNRTGSSQTCTDANGDDICDSSYALDASNIDYLPLAKIPNLVLTQDNISFSYILSEVENGEVKENVNVTINATVYNSGLGDASNINVSFYDGSPEPGNNIANATITNIDAGSSGNATIYWNSIIGTHNISIKTDPENTLVETDDSNNNASKFINVSAWQKYYGNISGNITLKGQTGNSFMNWSWDTNQGNVFVSSVPSFDYSNLQALGRKKNGGIAQNNFGRADELLNMTPGSNNATGFINNNITQLFSLNGNGTDPRNVTSFTVYGRTIYNVPIVNSTNTTNYVSVENSTFITGILWDTTKDNGDGDYGDDGEELVFITGINVGTTGLGNSSHNYETGTPSTIRKEGNVYFFVELK
jgi:parallel beta-helix repeat protein